MTDDKIEFEDDNAERRIDQNIEALFFDIITDFDDMNNIDKELENI